MNKTTQITPIKFLAAYKAARKSRKNKYEVYLFDQNREERIVKMHDDIKNRTYKHHPYKTLILHDSKKRNIASPVFEDHILHHVIYASIYEILDKKMVYASFACRKGYGLHKGIIYLCKLISRLKRKHTNCYYLKLDFSKYFFSIPHAKLIEKIRKHIHDEDILYAIDVVLGSYQSSAIYDNLLKANDFYINEPKKGLPIGGILSQLFANFYLNDLDQYIKHTLKLNAVRYMDDIILIGDKEELQAKKQAILDFSLSEHLIIHPNKVSFHPVSDGVRFTGYHIKDDHIFAGKRMKLSFQKFMDVFEDIEPASFGLNMVEKQRGRNRMKHFERMKNFKSF